MRTFVVTLLALYLSVSMGIVSGTGPLCFRFTAKPGPEAGQTNPPDLRHLPRQALTDCARPMLLRKVLGCVLPQNAGTVQRVTPREINAFLSLVAPASAEIDHAINRLDTNAGAIRKPD